MPEPLRTSPSTFGVQVVSAPPVGVPRTVGTDPMRVSSLPSSPVRAPVQQTFTRPTSKAPPCSSTATIPWPVRVTSTGAWLWPTPSLSTVCPAPSRATSLIELPIGCTVTTTSSAGSGRRHVMPLFGKRIVVPTPRTPAKVLIVSEAEIFTGPIALAVPRSWSGPKWSATTAQVRCGVIGGRLRRSRQTTSSRSAPVTSGSRRPRSSAVRTVKECAVIAASHQTSSPNGPAPTWPGVTVNPSAASCGIAEASGPPSARSWARQVNRDGNGGVPGSTVGMFTASTPARTAALPRAQFGVARVGGSQTRPGTSAGSASVPAPPSVSQ